MARKYKSPINVVHNVLHDNAELILQIDEKFLQLEQNIRDIKPLEKLHNVAMKE